MLVVNKCDVLEQVNQFKLYYNNELIKFNNLDEMKDFIQNILDNLELSIIFSGDKESATLVQR